MSLIARQRGRVAIAPSSLRRLRKACLRSVQPGLDTNMNATVMAATVNAGVERVSLQISSIPHEHDPPRACLRGTYTLMRFSIDFQQGAV